MTAAAAAVMLWLYQDTTSDPRELVAAGRAVSVVEARGSLRLLRDRGLAQHRNHGPAGQWWELTPDGVSLVEHTIRDEWLNTDDGRDLVERAIAAVASRDAFVPVPGPLPFGWTP